MDNNVNVTNELEVFTNEEFGSVRVIMIDGEPWFVGKDIAQILGYANPRKAVIDHVDLEDKMDGVTIRDSIGRNQNPIFVNESGLYALIFGSKLELAKKFKHWVTGVVLPSIRKNGGYISNQEHLSDEEIMANALLVAQRVINEKNKQIEEMKPKAKFADLVDKARNASTMNQFSKYIQDECGGTNIGRNRMMRWLREHGILMKDNTPYQKYINNGWFKLGEKTLPNGTTVPVPLITGKGQRPLAEMIIKDLCDNIYD